MFESLVGLPAFESQAASGHRAASRLSRDSMGSAFGCVEAPSVQQPLADGAKSRLPHPYRAARGAAHRAHAQSVLRRKGRMRPQLDREGSDAVTPSTARPQRGLFLIRLPLRVKRCDAGDLVEAGYGGEH